MKNVFIFLLCLICLSAFLPAMNNGFVFDDKALIVHNPFIKSVKLLPEVFKRGIYDHWVGSGMFDRMYRPLQVLSYWLDYKLWGLNPFGFRLTNLLLHAFNAALAYFLLSLIFSSSAVALFAAVLFFVHPLNTSSVFYISARADLLSCFFILFSLLFFLKYIRSRKVTPGRHALYIFSLCAGAAALLCRESSIVLFTYIIMVLCAEKAKPREYTLVLPFVLLNIFYFALRFVVFGASGLFTHPEFLSFPLRLLNFFNIALRYIMLLFMPLDLRLFRTTAFILDPVSLSALLAWVGILFFIVMAIRSKRSKAAFWGTFWFLSGILPVLFLLDGYPAFGKAMMAESWAYLSSIGFFLLFSSLLTRMKKVKIAVWAAFVIFYAALSAANSAYWKNDLLVHKRIAQYAVNPDPLRKDLIDDYLSCRMYVAALEEVKKFSENHPASALSDIVWGNYYFATGQISRAEENYKIALAKTGKRNFFLYYRLSLCYKLMGKNDASLDAAIKSFHANPYFELNLDNLKDLQQ